MSDDRYRAADDGPECEVKVKGSRFLGRLLRADGEAAATRQLEAIRRRYHDATHHCWAWRLGEPGVVVERSDDDGEPSGSAGRPILDALRGAALHDGLLIVTRWFGGTKLGTGGLVRAYGEAAERSIEAAPARTAILAARLRVTCGYDDVGRIEAELARHGAELIEVEREYGERTRFRLCLPRSRTDAIGRCLIEATAGRAELERLADERLG